jgi:cytochrome b involved in lipid metabolism
MIKLNTILRYIHQVFMDPNKDKPAKEFTREEMDTLNKQKGSKLCLVGLFGKVYDLSRFLAAHQGGERAIRDVAGDIIDDVFEDGNHRSMKGQIPKYLAKYQVGVLKM